VDRTDGSPPDHASDAMRAHGWPDEKLVRGAIARTQARIERRFAAKLSRAA
jgi:hypothetical protein